MQERILLEKLNKSKLGKCIPAEHWQGSHEINLHKLDNFSNNCLLKFVFGFLLQMEG